jgi:DNA repair photolyase
MYDSCLHGCVYCYANASLSAAAKNAARHDPAAPLLFGSPLPGAAIKEKAANEPDLFSFT